MSLNKDFLTIIKRFYELNVRTNRNLTYRLTQQLYIINIQDFYFNFLFDNSIIIFLNWMREMGPFYNNINVFSLIQPRHSPWRFLWLILEHLSLLLFPSPSHSPPLLVPSTGDRSRKILRLDVPLVPPRALICILLWRNILLLQQVFNTKIKTESLIKLWNKRILFLQ